MRLDEAKTFDDCLEYYTQMMALYCLPRHGPHYQEYLNGVRRSIHERMELMGVKEANLW